MQTKIERVYACCHWKGLGVPGLGSIFLLDVAWFLRIKNNKNNSCRFCLREFWAISLRTTNSSRYWDNWRLVRKTVVNINNICIEFYQVSGKKRAALDKYIFRFSQDGSASLCMWEREIIYMYLYILGQQGLGLGTHNEQLVSDYRKHLRMWVDKTGNIFSTLSRSHEPRRPTWVSMEGREILTWPFHCSTHWTMNVLKCSGYE